MKLVKMQCNSCNSNLNIDMDNLIAFCPYCGKKLLIDMENLSRILEAKEVTKQIGFKEETKRFVANEIEKTKRFKGENELKEMVVAYGTICIMFAICAIVIIFG